MHHGNFGRHIAGLFIQIETQDLGLQSSQIALLGKRNEMRYFKE